jgi:hypothetical protein
MRTTKRPGGYKMLSVRNLLLLATLSMIATSAQAAATMISSGQTISFNTTAVAYTIDAGPAVSGTIENGAAKFNFNGLEIQAGATVEVAGSRALLLASNGNIIVNTTINMSGLNGWVTSATVYAGGIGGPGGYAGGGKRTIGEGPGGGNTSLSYGAGGGGHGGMGGSSSRICRGSADTTVPSAGLGGVANGAPQIYLLQGGSGGGGGKNSSGGGGGGGAIALVAISGNITIGSSGVITCNGGDGVFPTYDPAELRYGGGGGAGGAIRIDAGSGTMTIDGQLSAKGGHGSDSQWMTSRSDYREYHSGGGGGGRIAIYTASGTYAGLGTIGAGGGTGGNLLNPPPSGYQTAPGCNGTAGTSNTYQGTMMMPGQATGPNPGNGATGIDIHSPALSWQAGDASATAWDVYFGTSSQSLAFLTNVTSRAAAAGELGINTQYSWRVDEYNVYGTVTGAVWTFTTRGTVCITPPVGDANGDCYVNFIDSAILASEWLICNRDPVSECWQ